MEKCKLVGLGTEYEAEVTAYRDEVARDAGGKADGTGSLLRFADAAEWIAYNRLFEDPATTPEGFVPGNQYLFVREADHHVVGMIQFRWELNEALENYGGHIGYSVRPSERRKGYAKAMLADCLALCRERGYSRVLITCRTDNEASRRTILANGGVYEDTRFCAEENKSLERYWITL